MNKNQKIKHLQALIAASEKKKVYYTIERESDRLSSENRPSWYEVDLSVGWLAFGSIVSGTIIAVTYSLVHF